MLPSPPATPLRGKYLVRQPLANSLLGILDRILVATKRSSPSAIPAPRRILLANGAHLGDVLIASAVVPVLKGAFPDCRIGFLIGRWALPVLQGQPLVDHIHVVDHWKLNRAARSLPQKLLQHRATRRQALGEIRRLGYDVAIDLYPNFPNNIPLLWQAGVPTRIGYTSGGFGPLLTHALDWTERDCHALDYHAALLQFLLPPNEPESRPRLLQPILPPVKGRGEVSPPLPRNYLVLHPGAGAAFKEWPVAKWRTLAARLVAAGHTLVFTGSSAAEKRTIAAVVNGLPHCVDQCGELSWAGFANVVRQARLLIGVDSVAGHVAAAAGTPCLVIASGVPNRHHWRPQGPAVRVLTHAVPCAPCYRSRGCAGMECVRQVDVDEVLAAVQGLLAMSSSVPA